MNIQYLKFFSILFVKDKINEIIKELNTHTSGGVFVEAIDRTGTSITFDLFAHYNATTPATGNITINHTKAKKGMVQYLRHNWGTLPTWPTEVKRISGTYELGVDNEMYFEYISSTRINLFINQLM